MYPCGEKRAFWIGSKCVAALDLSDHSVKIDLIARDDNNRVARADLFVVNRKLDNGSVAVLVCDGFEIERICVKTQRLRK